MSSHWDTDNSARIQLLYMLSVLISTRRQRSSLSSRGAAIETKKCGVVPALLTLVLASCGNGTTDPAGSHSVTADAKPPPPSLNDWDLDTKHDVISETDTVHLVKILSSTDKNDLRVQIDLTCPTPGVVSAEIKSDPAIYVWGQSTGDFIAQGILRSAGVSANPVSTLVQWRIGKSIHSGHVAQGKYNNVADIDNFIKLGPSEPWIGSLAVVTDTDHGQLAVETPIDTPNALEFLKKCTRELEKYNAEKAVKDAGKKAAAKVAADAAKEGDALIARGTSAFIGVIDTFWPKCGEYHVMKNMSGDRASVQTRDLAVRFRGGNSLTQSDRKNGVEWRGKYGGRFNGQRRFTVSSYKSAPIIVWTDWTGGPDCDQIEGEAWLKNGGWNAEVHDSESCPVQHISCSSMPAG
jgi:hypothetical protein